MNYFEQIEEAAKKMEINERGIAEASFPVFHNAVKMMNPTDLSAIGNILAKMSDELLTLSVEYQIELRKLVISLEKAEEKDWENIKANIVAYSSVIAYLKNLKDKQEEINYYMDKRVPACFRENQQA